MRIEKASPPVEVTAIDTDVDIYLVSNGRKFILKSIMVNNRTTSDARIRLWDGPSADGKIRLDIGIAAGATEGLDEAILGGEPGHSFSNKVVAQSTVQPVTIQVRGFEF